MSVDNTTAEPNPGIQQNGGQSEHVNGVTNGYPEKHKSSSHKSSSHDKHRSKDKDRDRSKDHKSSSKHHSSSSSRDKDKHSSSSKDKDRSHSHKSSNRDKERENEKSDKEKSSNKDSKEKSDKDKSSDKEKHRSKEHKSSSRDKDGEKKESSSSSHRDKSDKDKSKHKHSSSSSKDTDKSSSKSKEKDRHRDKDRERSKDKHSKHRDRESDSKSRSSEANTSKNHEVIPSDKDLVKPHMDVVKEESESQEMPPMKIEVESQNESRMNLNDSQSSCDYSLTQFKDEIKEELPIEEEETYEENDNDQDEDYEASQEKVDVKEEPEESDDDVPLTSRLNSSKRKIESEDSEGDVPITQRKKKKAEKKTKKAKKRSCDSDDDYDEDVKPAKIKVKKEKTKVKKEKVKTEKPTQESPTKRKKKVEEEQEVWKWWEEEKKNDGTKWSFLEHKGPLFAPPYERLPPNVKFLYDGQVMQLSQDAEEVACFYAKMLTHDYTSKPVFNENFFKDWRKTMTEKEKSIIKDLTKCDFRKMNAYFTDLSEKNKQRTKEEKQKIKEQNEAIVKEYGFCKIDGHVEKIGNFRIEPPGLFRGRGEHPKMGMVKKRVQPEDVMLNCSKDSVIPVAPEGHKWKEVRHDNTVTWLASWTENVQGQVKYVMLNPSSKLKGEKDWQKYETARKLAKCIDKIRETYIAEWKAKEMKIRQRAVALYFIDRLALRAGNEKDEDQADTVGCCSLRVEHIELHKEKDGKEYVVVFDFLGKDSIRYYNEIPVEKRVFKNLELFKENKKEGDDLFDRLNTTTLNEHLRELMDGLTAKVFRTYNASITLQKQLNELTDDNATIPEKILAYNRANRAVAILCNHQRAVPKSHDKSMSNLREKMNQKREQIEDLEEQVRDAAKAAKRGSVKEKVIHEKKKKALEKLREQLKRMEVQETDRDENKTIALGTSKLNYLDPRISVAWCKKFGVPIEKVYNKTQRDKFRWAIDMATEDYIF